MATLSFCYFEEAMEALQKAASNAGIASVVDQIDQQFSTGTLEVTPEQWAHLASAVLTHAVPLRTGKTTGPRAWWLLLTRATSHPVHHQPTNNGKTYAV